MTDAPRMTDDVFYAPGDPMERTFWKSSTLRRTVRGDYEDRIETREEREQVAPRKANLVSSLLRDGQHAPALDIDMQCWLVPSRTPGHFHLFIDKPMSWRKYKKLLKTLADVGIIEPGYARASIERGGTDLRMSSFRSWLKWGHP